MKFEETNKDDLSEEAEEEQGSKKSKLDKMDVYMKEPNKNKIKNKVVVQVQGVKRKHDPNENSKKKENSKKTYKRRVATYKGKRLELTKNREILHPTGTM